MSDPYSTVLTMKCSGISQLMCHNPPDQCKFMCEYLKLQDPSQNGKSCFQIKYDFTILRIVCLTIQ